MKIRHILFDLDNTLYPASNAIGEGISERMISYVARYFDLPFEEARRRRNENLPRFGTTLEWLQREHGFTDSQDYFAKVHPDSEIDELTFDPKLRPFLQSLGLPMTVLTNAPQVHADRLLRFFHIHDLFVGVHNVESNGLVGKPHPSAYRQAVESSGFTVAETVFLDDTVKYVRGYVDIGGPAILVSADPKEIEGVPEVPHIDSVYALPEILRRM